MKNLKSVFLLALVWLLTDYSACSKKDEISVPSDIWDIDQDGVPQFVNTNYIELDKIYRISRFRSSVGHDYSDAFEHCRSMKHYFEPLSTLDWSTVKIFSPVTGQITRVEEEWAGTKIEIASRDYPAFRFSVFHINPVKTFNIGEEITEGRQLGNHTGPETMSDIAVIVNDPTRQGRMISWFDVITDKIFIEYRNRGISGRDSMIISRELRDTYPLSCSGETFTSNDILENWVVLQ